MFKVVERLRRVYDDEYNELVAVKPFVVKYVDLFVCLLKVPKPRDAFLTFVRQKMSYGENVDIDEAVTSVDMNMGVDVDRDTALELVKNFEYVRKCVKLLKKVVDAGVNLDFLRSAKLSNDTIRELQEKIVCFVDKKAFVRECFRNHFGMSVDEYNSI